MATDAVDNIMSERNLLAIMNSKFVCCLKYAVQDNDNLYLMYDSNTAVNMTIAYSITIPINVAIS